MRFVYLVIGLISFAVGTVGVVVPVLPTFVFYMIALFCFMRSSEKLHQWFISSDLYKSEVAPFLERKGISRSTKMKLVLSITVTLGIGFYFLKVWPPGRIILAIVWITHVIYFIFGIKTKEELNY